VAAQATAFQFKVLPG